MTAAEKVVEAARQIDAAAKTVANQILTEQFDTVMPLLKELYRTAAASCRLGRDRVRLWRESAGIP